VFAFSSSTTEFNGQYVIESSDFQGSLSLIAILIQQQHSPDNPNYRTKPDSLEDHTRIDAALTVLSQ